MQQPIDAKTSTDIYPAVQAAKRFAAALGKSSEFQRYEEAVLRLRKSSEAQRLLNEFQQEQQNYQMMQSWGGANEESHQRLLKKQDTVLADPVLKDYFQAQEDLVKLLKEVNVFISEQIGIDFAGATKPAGGCC